MRTFEAMIGLTGSKALEARVKNITHQLPHVRR